jgi:hypothetical protein
MTTDNLSHKLYRRVSRLSQSSHQYYGRCVHAEHERTEHCPHRSAVRSILLSSLTSDEQDYSISGAKAMKARSWSIPIVNHTWLEDCFVRWKSLTVALEKYVVFPPGMDFSTILGVKGITGVELDLEDENLAQDDDEDVSNGEAPENTGKDPRELSPDPGNGLQLEQFEKRTTPQPLIAEKNSKDTYDNVENPDLEESPKRASSDMGEQLVDFATHKRVSLSEESDAAAPRMAALDSRSQKAHKGDIFDIEDDDSVVEEHLLTSEPSVKPKINRMDKTSVAESKTRSARAKNRARKFKGKTRSESMPQDSGSDSMTPEKNGNSPLLFSDSGTDTDFPDRVAPVGIDRRHKKDQEEVMNRTPNRVMSVLVPPPPYPVSPSKSVVDDDHHERHPNQEERTRNVRRGVGTSTDASQLKATRTYGKKATENRFEITRSPSRRAAASRATRNLKEKVMPDVVNYQMEMKRDKERKRDKQLKIRKQDESEDEGAEEDIRSVKKRKVGWELKSSKKVDQGGQDSRPRLKEKTPATSNEDSASEVAASPLRKPDAKRSTHSRIERYH